MIDLRTPQQRLCSRENAERLATRLFEQHGRPTVVVRTNDPTRPYVATDRPWHDDGQVDIMLTA